MKLVLARQDNIYLTCDYAEENGNNFLPFDSIAKLTIPLSSFDFEAINGNPEDTPIIYDLVNSHSLDMVFEFAKQVGTTLTLKLTLRSQFFSQFEEKFITSFTIAGLMGLIYTTPGDFAKQIIINTYGFQQFHDGDTFTFPNVTYSYHFIHEFQDSLTLQPIPTQIKLFMSTQGQSQDKLEINRKILNDGIATDVTIISSNDAHIKCHKSFLIAHSSVFESMLNSGMKEEITSVIEMKTVSELGVKSLLAYMYCWDLTEASNNCEIAVELLKVSDYYMMPRLNREISNILFNKPVEWFSADGALELFTWSNRLGRGHLKLRALKAVQMKFDELKTSSSYLELFRKDPAARELCNSALSMKLTEKNGNFGDTA